MINKNFEFIPQIFYTQIKILNLIQKYFTHLYLSVKTARKKRYKRRKKILNNVKYVVYGLFQFVLKFV